MQNILYSTVWYSTVHLITPAVHSVASSIIVVSYQENEEKGTRGDCRRWWVDEEIKSANVSGSAATMRKLVLIATLDKLYLSNAHNVSI